ncbi:TolC family protein [Methyloceanibacter sp.]|uniref:TolC family protein n=1 Tax=Methyloceanibacter sp. TaxID=1965321 RepID=UPI002CDEC48F|nr:TolC family protein [Methyloceanibacter sp.]HML93008.1 TolC family protein [Methyloceanibacter sp.]
MFRLSRYRCRKVLTLALLPLAGCQTLSPEGSFYEVADTVEGRLGQQISWDGGQYADPYVRSTIENLLAQPVTAETAVQIALLNNRDLQAVYADLGIAQANLVQAGLWKNPIIDGAVTFPTAGSGPTDYTFNIALQVIDILYIPLRRRVAESELAEAELNVTGQVMEVAGETYMAFVEYLGQRQLVGVFTQAVQSAKASVESAKALRQAGNITDYEYESEIAQQVEVSVRLAQAQTAASQARERVNRLMGVTGPQTQWRSADRLPSLPGRELPTGDTESRVIQASIDLAAARQEIITLGQRYRVVKATSLVPQLDAGGEIEREESESEAGPSFAAEIPLFDWGRARKASARMEILAAQDEFSALAVRIRSFARAQRATLLSARQTALYYANTVVPQTTRLLDAAERQYNAMQIGVFQLLQAKERQIKAGEDYVRALTTYWRERWRFAQLLKGKLPAEENDGGLTATASAPQREAGGH